MQVGLTFGLRNPAAWRQPWPEVYGEMLDLCEIAEEHGYDSVFISEHHFASDGYCPSVLATCAAVAARTQRIRIGTNILVLPLHHPIRVAEDAATVDVLSNGRFVLGVGAGYRQEEFETFGVPLSERGTRLEEGVELIREAWTEPIVNHSGRHYRVGGLHVGPWPVQSGGPPIWFGARTESATRRAGRMGDGLILSRGRAQLRWFREAAEDAGRDPDALSVATIRIVHVAESAEQALKEVGPHLLYHERSYQEMFNAGRDLAHERDAVPFTSVDELPLDRYILGTPDQVISRVRELEAQFGFDHLLMWARLPGLPIQVAERSLRLFGESVLPALRTMAPCDSKRKRTRGDAT